MGIFDNDFGGSTTVIEEKKEWGIQEKAKQPSVSCFVILEHSPDFGMDKQSYNIEKLLVKPIFVRPNVHLDTLFDEFKKKMQMISPNAKIEIYSEKLSEESIEKFNLKEYDYIIDCIDDLKAKYIGAMHELLIFTEVKEVTKYSQDYLNIEI